MRYRVESVLLAGLLLGMLLALPFIRLPYGGLDWTAYSQPYEPTQTPTSTLTLTPTATATSVATATATLPPTPPATATTAPTLDHHNYMPLIRRTSSGHPVSGSVLIEGGACCVGGTAGATIDIDVAFEATSPFGDVTQMRTRGSYGGGCTTEDGLAALPWEPFVSQRTFPVTVAINWIGFYVSVQYRDAAGLLSGVYCDDISVEGMPPQL
ncbi:MAG: hypothetical protein ACE5F6_19890 [Anaerolineae bacterium]